MGNPPSVLLGEKSIEGNVTEELKKRLGPSSSFAVSARNGTKEETREKAGAPLVLHMTNKEKEKGEPVPALAICEGKFLRGKQWGDERERKRVSTRGLICVVPSNEGRLPAESRRGLCRSLPFRQK